MMSSSSVNNLTVTYLHKEKGPRRKTIRKKTTTININLTDLVKDKTKVAMVLPEDQSIKNDTAKRESYAVEDEEATEAVSAILSTTNKDPKYPSTKKTQQQDKENSSNTEDVGD